MSLYKVVYGWLYHLLIVLEHKPSWQNRTLNIDFNVTRDERSFCLNEQEEISNEPMATFSWARKETKLFMINILIEKSSLLSKRCFSLILDFIYFLKNLGLSGPITLLLSKCIHLALLRSRTLERPCIHSDVWNAKGRGHKVSLAPWASSRLHYRNRILL